METLGQYELVRRLATGGMAEIYLARQVGPDGVEKRVVIKRILPHLAENEEFVSMFLQEARVAVRLNHANIVQIFDLGQEDGSLYLAMEFIDGEDVRRIWKRSEELDHPIPVPLVCRIVMDAAAGLDYAHKKTDQGGLPLNIIHRDVSPQNILVSYEGVVKVVDFGIAKAADQASHTRPGVLKGKYSYLSPEQASGRTIDQTTDQFALGIVLHELLTQRRLFKRSSEIQTLTAVTECRVPAPSSVNSRVPPELDRIVLKALSRDAADRYRTMGEFRLALEEWAASIPEPSSAAALGQFVSDLYADKLARERSISSLSASLEISDSSARKRKNEPTPAGKRSRSEAAVPVAADPAGEHGPATAEPTRSIAPEEPAAPRSGMPTTPGIKAAPPASPSKAAAPVPKASPRGMRSRWDGLTAQQKLLGGAALAAVAAALFGLLILAFTSHGPVLPEGRDPVSATPEDPPPAAPKLATLKITTVPPGASVVLDGLAFEETTPFSMPELPLGDHDVVISLPGYQDVRRKITVNEARVELLSIELARAEAQKVRLLLDTEPRGAQAIADGKELGPTPVTLEVLAERTLDVQFALEGYLPKRQSIPVGVGPEQELRVALDKRPVSAGVGTLVVTSEPPAVLWNTQNRQELGNTPFRGKLPAGKHTLVLVNRDQGLEHTFTVEVEADGSETRNFRFRRGEVVFVVKPWADVYLRGKKVGTLPMPPLSLLEGQHTFTLVNPDLGKKKTLQVTIHPGVREKVSLDLAAE